MSRHFWVLMHRYAGLAITAFLVVLGITGSLLVFVDELSAVLAPQLFPPARVGTPLDAGTLAAQAERLEPRVSVGSLYLGVPGNALAWVEPRLSPQTGQPYVLDFDQIFLDPISGRELGRRKTSDPPVQAANVMPFIYRLHYSLALDSTGVWIMGFCALVWTLDCFVSLFLTLPSLRKPAAYAGMHKGSFWKRWMPAWKVKRGASAYRLNFDLHRAGGLWVWLMLGVFAWSGVYMNLHDQVYAPVTRTVMDYPPQYWELPAVSQAPEKPLLTWSEAQVNLNQLLKEQSQLHGFTIDRPVSLNIDRERGIYIYSMHSSLDFQEKRGRTTLVMDAYTGALKQFHLPKGQQGGNTLTNWLATLHEANVFGMPYRIFVCLLGLLIVALTVTGFVIWLKKRRARKTVDRQQHMRRILRGNT